MAVLWVVGGVCAVLAVALVAITFVLFRDAHPSKDEWWLE